MLYAILKDDIFLGEMNIFALHVQFVFRLPCMKSLQRQKLMVYFLGMCIYNCKFKHFQ